MSTKLDKIFDAVVTNPIFKNKYVLQSNHSPEEIPHRDKQIEQVASILAPSLRLERPSNLFVYGQTGTGKTLCVQFVGKEMLERAKKQNIPLKIEYLNCKMRKISDTEYRILAEIIKKLGYTVPATGLPTEQVYSKFIEILDKEKQLVILILDEIDQAVKKINDNFLYNLTRLNSELVNGQLCLIGISNDLQFLDNVDPRVRSSLSEEELIFSPYNALQLQEILKKRAETAFNEGVLEEGVLSKCAAFAAREHGDARRALDLLRISGEISEREGSKKVSLRHVDEAREKLERDKIIDIVDAAPKQFQLVLLSILNLIEQKNIENIFTGDVYNLYYELCKKIKMEILTQRRISDIIGEFDMLGLINARVISKGRHGRTREIKLVIPEKILPKIKSILLESLNL